MKKTFAVFLILAMLLLAACGEQARETAAPAEDLIVVGFSQLGAESDWRQANTNSMKAALSEENGYRLIFDEAQQKQEKQITAIRNYIQLGVDYIVLAPGTESGWDTVLTEAAAANIPVIIVDRMIEADDDSLFTCWVGSDFHQEGRCVVQWMDAHFAGLPLRIVHLQGNIGSSAQIGRTAALDEGLEAHPDWELVFREDGGFTEAKGQELIEGLLAEGVDFNVIYAENDNMAYGAITALKAAGLTPGKDVYVLSFDANRTALNMVLNGEISFDAECNPLHGVRVQAIIEKLESGQNPPKLTFVEETSFDAETLTQEIIDAREY